MVAFDARTGAEVRRVKRDENQGGDLGTPTSGAPGGRPVDAGGAASRRWTPTHPARHVAARKSLVLVATGRNLGAEALDSPEGEVLILRQTP
jgi:hypothetical protein